jgi:hypothetical protein
VGISLLTLVVLFAVTPPRRSSSTPSVIKS